MIVSRMMAVFPGLPVADDQLALSAADRNHRVDGFDSSLQRFAHWLAIDHARRNSLQVIALLGGDRPFAVERHAQRIHHAPHQRLAHRHRHNSPRALHRVAFAEFRCSRPESPRPLDLLPGSVRFRKRRAETRSSRQTCSARARARARFRRPPRSPSRLRPPRRSAGNSRSARANFCNFVRFNRRHSRSCCRVYAFSCVYFSKLATISLRVFPASFSVALSRSRHKSQTQSSLPRRPQDRISLHK